MADLLATATDLIGDIAGPYVLLAPTGRSIGGIIPNVTVQETISDENTITVHPVQNGAPISDHVFANPIVCDMLVGWSDSTGQYPGYVQDVYQAILALRDTRQPFDVYTGKRMLSSMLFGNITPTTDETSENALFLRVRLQQVIISNTATAGGTTAAQANPQATGGEPNMGTVTARPMGQGGIGSDAVAGAAAIRAMQTPVTTGGGISGLPVAA